jgi:hypothetical protein
MRPGTGGANVRKPARYAGNDCGPLHHGFLDRINVDEAAQRGDYLVYPHQPEYGKFMIVEATGPYQFAVAGDSLSGDFRSYRTCRLVTTSPLDWYDPIVPPRIKTKLGLQGRFYQLYDFDLFSQMLGSLPNAGAPARADLSPRLGRIASEIMPTIPSLIWREFPRQDLSWLCNELFNRMGYSTVLQEGAGEAGSDLIVNVGSPLLPRPLTVGVQVFAWEGNVAGSCLQVKLQQLVGGWQANQLDYGVLLTTGNCGAECAELIAAHNKAHTDRPVVLIEGQMLSKLFIRYLLFDPRDE